MDTSQALRRCGDRIECWDDDPDFADLDLKLTRTPSTSPKSKSNMRSNIDNHNRDRRESISSRMSIQSSICDFDSPDGWDHERQVLLDDSPATAIASAINAGIPIPENVPSSALIGGTIKRLGTTRKSKRIASHDDWGEDLELPMSGMALKIRGQERNEFPDTLQQILAGSRSRGNSPARGSLMPVINASSQLNKFRELSEDEDFFADSDDLPMLKVSPGRHTLRPQRSTASLLMTPPLSESATRGSPSVDEDFENDFEFPADAPLQLNIKLGETIRGPVVHGVDNDFEDWAEGSSLGSRFGVTLRDRGMGGMGSGSVSIVSASVSSITAESEDEAPFDGLELPLGPLPDFHEILEKRKRATFAEDTEMIDAPAPRPKQSKEDFLEGIEIGDGEVFDTRKLTLNRNVKHKQPTRKTSPVRRSAMSLTFTTNKPPPTTSLSGVTGNRLRHGHPTLAPPIPSLEPVVERERENQNPLANKRPEPRNRWSNNSGNLDRWSAKSEGIPANIPPPPPVPHTRFHERQRSMGGKGSLRALKEKNQQGNAPTTTNAQLLRMKRSMPNIGGRATPGSPKNNTVRSPSRNSGGRPASRNSVGRPPSSTGGRPPSSTGGRSTATGRNDVGRSKTPGERKPAPFLPAGSTVRQSHHISAKISQQTLEYKEKIAAERRTNSRHQQRTPHHSPSSSIASSKTKRGTPTIAPEPLRRQAAAIETLRQPTRKRNFGDGTELETFDDLPTSAKAENRFVVTPVGRGAPKATKSQSVPITRASGKDAGKDGESPAKRIDLSRDLSSRFAEVPRFARDTSASRNAREQRMGITNTGAGHTGTNQWKQQVAARGTASPKNRRKPQLKPQLIKPMGSISNPPKAAAAVNGMTYNSKTFKWEGNENEVKGFETDKIPTPPRPALISNVNHSGSKLGIQVVGGMVFDPASMSWLKVDEDPDEENDDPFEGFDDLMDHDMTSNGFSGDGGDSAIGPIFGGGSAGGGSRSGTRLSGGYGEFVVGEEFDVGPEFVRRQREEEDRWRKRVDGWISTGEATKMENKWAIRDLLER